MRKSGGVIGEKKKRDALYFFENLVDLQGFAEKPSTCIGNLVVGETVGDGWDWGGDWRRWMEGW